MNRPLRYALPLAICLGLSTGAVLRSTIRTSSQKRQMNESALRHSPAKTSPSPRSLVQTESKTNPVVSQLQCDLALATEVTRWLYWMAAIDRASMDDVLALGHYAGTDSALLELVVHKAISLGAHRFWDGLKPRLLYRSHRENNIEQLGHIFFAKWVAHDSSAAIAALAVAECDDLLSIRAAAADAAFYADPEGWLKVASKWRLSRYLGPPPPPPVIEGTPFLRWVAKDPRHAMEATLAHCKSPDLVRHLQKAIATEWVKIDPMAAAAYATSGSLSK